MTPARVRHPSQRRGRGLTARGARAAADNADDQILHLTSRDEVRGYMKLAVEDAAIDFVPDTPRTNQ